MYDWPETRADNDARWAELCDELRRKGIDAPESLARRNADLPPVPGGIRDVSGTVIAPDPATLPPDKFDLHALWMHPALLFAQTCWGPMSLGMGSHVQVVGQPDYSDCEGGEGEFYSSAIVIRGDESPPFGLPAPADGGALLPLGRMRGARFAFNSADSMSGILALGPDLATLGESLAIFSERLETGGHRASIRAVAEGKADVAAIDCRSWKLFKRFEPDVSARLQVVGWTARRKGLPFITAKSTPPETVRVLRQTLASARMLAG
jgi:ABC-type phosphate/phosphonate transport system substrate-binding protein